MAFQIPNLQNAVIDSVIIGCASVCLFWLYYINFEI